MDKRINVYLGGVWFNVQFSCARSLIYEQNVYTILCGCLLCVCVCVFLSRLNYYFGGLYSPWQRTIHADITFIPRKRPKYNAPLNRFRYSLITFFNALKWFRFGNNTCRYIQQWIRLTNDIRSICIVRMTMCDEWTHLARYCWMIAIWLE